MKKFIVFSISFIFLFMFIQIGYGMIQTVAYTPDMESAWIMSDGLSQDVVLKSSSDSPIPTIIAALLAAVISLFIVRRFRLGVKK